MKPDGDVMHPGIDAPAGHSWDQQAGEPNRWFARFLTYADLPPDTRSVRSAWLASLDHTAASGSNGQDVAHPARVSRKGRGTPADWLDRARRHNWDARAADRDAAQRDQEAASIAALRAEWATGRRELITASTATVRAALDGLDLTGPNAPGLGEVVRAMARLFDLQRREFGDDLTDLRVTMTGPVPGLTELLTGLRRDGLSALEAELDDECRARGLEEDVYDSDRT